MKEETWSNASPRKKLFVLMATGCWIHFALAFIQPFGQFNGLVLALGAGVLAFALGLLAYTKRTLPFEEQLPEWFYKVAAIGWAVTAVVWLVAGKA